jgi:hypothetical protein
MAVVIVLVIAIIVIVIVVQNNKRKKAIEDLQNSGGYDVAVQIKNELENKGYKVSDLNIIFEFGGVPKGYFSVSGDSESGSIEFSKVLRGLTVTESRLQIENAQSIGYLEGWQRTEREDGLEAVKCPVEFIYAVENANIGVLVKSEHKTHEIPAFLELVAKAMRDSGYDFEHPDWLHEDPRVKAYLNVMF